MKRRVSDSADQVIDDPVAGNGLLNRRVFLRNGGLLAGIVGVSSLDGTRLAVAEPLPLDV